MDTPDMARMNDSFRDKTILITGGTGSFGKAFAYNLLKEDLCAKLIIFSRDEWKQWQMKQQHPLFNHPKIRYFLGDVRDVERLNRAFHQVDIVIHAAALKQVPAAEYNPAECVKTNVLGAMNVINAAIDASVQKVIALSTDKSVNPINLYGATKLCSDKLFVAGNSYVGNKGYPKFSVVRYGNVLGSRGSLIPFWQSLLQKGEKSLPITDKRMTRFWIALTQAVEFVKSCIIRMSGSEIFIPKSPSMRIEDLAHALAPGVKTHITGIRPGEKIHEVLLSTDESRYAFEEPSCYILLPNQSQESASHILAQRNALLRPVEEGFCYTSDTNPKFLNQERLQKMLNDLKQDPTLAFEEAK